MPFQTQPMTHVVLTISVWTEAWAKVTPWSTANSAVWHNKERINWMYAARCTVIWKPVPENSTEQRASDKDWINHRFTKRAPSHTSQQRNRFRCHGIVQLTTADGIDDVSLGNQTAPSNVTCISLYTVIAVKLQGVDVGGNVIAHRTLQLSVEENCRLQHNNMHPITIPKELWCNRPKQIRL